MTDVVVEGKPPQSWKEATSGIAAAMAAGPSSPAEGVAPALAPTSVPIAFNIGWLLVDLRTWATERARSEANGGRPANAGVAASSLTAVSVTLDTTAGALTDGSLSAEAVDCLFAPISDAAMGRPSRGVL